MKTRSKAVLVLALQASGLVWLETAAAQVEPTQPTAFQGQAQTAPGSAPAPAAQPLAAPPAQPGAQPVPAPSGTQPLPPETAPPAGTGAAQPQQAVPPPSPPAPPPAVAPAPAQPPGYPAYPAYPGQPAYEPYEQEPPPTQPARTFDRRHFAIAVAFLKEQSFGLGLRGRLNHVGLEATLGAAPYFFAVSGTCEDFHAGAALHATGSFLVFISNQHSKFVNGLRFAGHYDELFGAGGSLGWMGEINLGQVLALQFGAGIQIYPDGEERAENELISLCEEDTGGVFFGSTSVEAEAVRDAVTPVLTTVQPYIGGSLVIYIF